MGAYRIFFKSFDSNIFSRGFPKGRCDFSSMQKTPPCHLTQEQLAEKVGVSRQTIIAIENNKYNPSLVLAFKPARLFEVAIEDIFFYETKDEPGYEK